MLSPDAFFQRYHSDFPAVTRGKARSLFRRAIRHYYVLQRKYVIDPESGDRVERVFVGEVIQQQRMQRRRVKRFFTGHLSAGRSERPEIKVLISKIFILWGRYASTSATLSRKSKAAIPTNFEIFLFDLMPRLGAPDVRRYVEAHWRERK